MNAPMQTLAVVAMNLRSLPQRMGSSLVIVIGSAGVVAVLVAVLSMSAGMAKTLQSAGRSDRAIVLRNGSASESGSTLTREAIRIIQDAPGVARKDGTPIASAEPLRLLKLFKLDGSQVTVPLRGVGPRAFEVRPEIEVVEGRVFRPSVNEVIVGQAAARQYRDLRIGSTITTRSSTWTVVGIFTSSDAHDSELFADAETLLSPETVPTYASVTVQLESANAFQAFADFLATNPALRVDVLRERDYYARQSATVNRLLSILVYAVGSIMSLGAIFGALNTMYSAVSTRAREIATLRALGFSSTSIVTSVLFEALLLGALGGLIGVALAWFFVGGHTVSTTQGTSNAQLIFDIAVTPSVATIGIVAASVIGLIGGCLPALRAARLPVATALRAT